MEAERQKLLRAGAVAVVHLPETGRLMVWASHDKSDAVRAAACRLGRITSENRGNDESFFRVELRAA